MLIGEIGPAIATVIVTLAQGIVILFMSAKEIEFGIHKMFNTNFLLVFLLEVALWAAIIMGFTSCSDVRRTAGHYNNGNMLYLLCSAVNLFEFEEDKKLLKNY